MKKLEEEKIIEYFLLKGYKVLSRYKSSSTPLIVEKKGYKAQISYNHLKEGNKPILFGKRCPYWKENIKLFLHIKFPNIYFVDVKSYKKSGKTRTIVTMKCECGEIFEKTWEHIFTDKYVVCKKCALNKSIINNRKNNNKKYIKILKDKGYELINKNEDILTNKLIEIREISTNYKGFIYGSHISKFKKINVFSLYTNKKNLVHNLNQYAKNNYINVEVMKLDELNEIWKTQSVECKCECGEIFHTTYRAFQKGKWVCDKCSRKYSNNELFVQKFLEENNIEFISEYTINSCKDVMPLRFDFYLKKYNILIEIDGEHHYKPVNFGGNMTNDESYERYLKYKHRDKIKDDFCEENNIPLLRIKYTSIYNNEYKDIINNFIQTVQV